MSGIDIGHIIEKLKSILNEEKSLKYFNNVTLPLGNETIRGNIISGKDGVNCFLSNIFYSYIENNVSNNIITNLIIFNKRIIVRTMSGKSDYICFGTFSNGEKEFNVDRFWDKVKRKIEITDYILIIKIYRNCPNELFRVKYNFYLKSVKDFFDDDGDLKYWKIRNNKDFNFCIKNNLGSPIFTYSYNYE